MRILEWFYFFDPSSFKMLFFPPVEPSPFSFDDFLQRATEVWHICPHAGWCGVVEHLRDPCPVGFRVGWLGDSDQHYPLTINQKSFVMTLDMGYSMENAGKGGGNFLKPRFGKVWTRGKVGYLSILLIKELRPEKRVRFVQEACCWVGLEVSYHCKWLFDCFLTFGYPSGSPINMFR